MAKRRIRLPRQVPPDAYERQYRTFLFEIIKQFKLEVEALDARITAAANAVIALRESQRYDAPSDDFARVFSELDAALWRRIPTPDKLKPTADGVSRYQRSQLKKQAEALAISIPEIGAQVSSRVDLWAYENVKLISSLRDSFRDSLFRKISATFHAGERHESIASFVAEATDETQRRGELIARDQIATLNGQLNADRQQAAGIKKFVWRTMQDNRVRSEHEDREGQVYDYDDPPDGELPGAPINCRCFAEPYIEGYDTV